jgi:hypothetical protein
VSKVFITGQVDVGSKTVNIIYIVSKSNKTKNDYKKTLAMRFPAISLALALALHGQPCVAFTSNALQQPFTQHFSHRGVAVGLRASTLDDTDKEIKINGSNDRFIIDDNNNDNKSPSFTERFTNSGIASAAAMATAAVNAAVSMKTLEAPTVDKSYISLDRESPAELDDEGLPRVYDKDLIEQYWAKERGALNRRWGEFVGKAVPFLTKLTTLFIRDGKILDKEIPALSRQARIDLQDLGATFIKAGQMMSVRPDVLPQVRIMMRNFSHCVRGLLVFHIASSLELHLFPPP